MEKSIYDFKVKGLNGKPVSLASYKGKVLLIVNTASKCGEWYQMKDLQKMYERYNKEGLEILGFPSNSFKQEPKSGSEIGEACEVNFGVTFKMMEKGPVLGAHAQPLYKYLRKEAGMFPLWNFHKYIVDRNGKVVTWYNPFKRVKNATITETIEKCLKEPFLKTKSRDGSLIDYRVVTFATPANSKIYFSKRKQIQNGNSTNRQQF